MVDVDRLGRDRGPRGDRGADGDRGDQEEQEMNIPKQCERCVLLDICIENNCLKEKPCASQQEPSPIDEDLLAEMRERMGIHE